MKNIEDNSNETRICRICKLPLPADSHGNSKAHKTCAYQSKKQRQKEKYKIGNAVKLMIQKNEAVASHLYILDKERRGIPYLGALEQGLKFNCPTTKIRHLNKEIQMFDRYGYYIETVDEETLIFIHHDTTSQ